MTKGTSRAERDAREAAGVGPEADGGDEVARLEAENAAKEKALRSSLESQFGKYGFIVMPSEAEGPILVPAVRLALHQWLFEINARAALKPVGLEPRMRAMLSGPPGCGKTTLAHHVAARIGVPMVVVQAHSLNSKYVGESAMNIGALFRAARRSKEPVALFFDEFDAIAKEREGKSGSSAADEKASITVSLLQEFDRHKGLLFAATNNPKLIDRALWRRFQMQIEIGLPGEVEREAIVRRYLMPLKAQDETVAYIADMLAGASPAFIQECCETLKRMLVLSPMMKLDINFPDLIRRLANVVQPADEQEPPALWSAMTQFITDAAEVPWPPEPS